MLHTLYLSHLPQSDVYSPNLLQDLDSTDRSLVKEGQVYLKNIKKLYQCILFNDFLVFAHGDSRQSKVELQLNLEAIWFEDLEDLDPQTSKLIQYLCRILGRLGGCMDSSVFLAGWLIPCHNIYDLYSL